jgi:DNA-binding CsgD family transcriptional regulator
MGDSLSLNSREQALLLEFMEALNSSLHLSEVFSRANGVLRQLLPADYAAMCVSKPDRPGDYDWVVAEMPVAFFSNYPEVAAKDFVRNAVVRRPNVVLRDTEMVRREELERNPFYQRCRELGMPLEHVMAVMLDVQQDWHGGLTLYREQRQGFSRREQALLQLLTPVLASTLRNCRMLGEVETRGHLVDALFRHQGLESLVLTPPSTEVMRTPHATSLLAAWFAPSELTRQGVPAALVDHLAKLGGPGRARKHRADTWERSGPDKSLKVTFVPLPEQEGRRLWALLLQEIPHVTPVPAEWNQRLSPGEARVASCVLQGWDNRLIADHLGCRESTVKKHLQRAFAKLGVESRAALMRLAARH